MIKILEKRFDELVEQLTVMTSTETLKIGEFGRYRQVDSEMLLNWSVKTKSLIANACGKDSEHYLSFVEAEKIGSYEDEVNILQRVRAVFLAAREDFQGGYLTSVKNLVQAELAGDELDQARELLDSGYIGAGAVIAGVVLETTLRTLCNRHGIQLGSMDKMNADLAKKGQYNSLVQKRITSLAAVRNSAAHGKTSEYNIDDVKNLISETERFVIDALR